MTLRRTLLGVAGVVAVCGAALAGPPSGPLSEGREVDPVVRDFQLNEPPAAVRREPAPVDQKGDLFRGSLLAALYEAIMHGITIPLGSGRVDDMH
ncbi:hypothetical protein [Frigoriglobus tundricola]|uniref:Uncharacterized protein n=1 Tax=Frigoriglobus tundricola TaxID=2774151 RepID=A0A6M5YSR1_9BACT|nr:hypothetical protein [Frigoriglobus tundricola]QJW96002.1 hypothetical protein FTUN_3556 [Frigoriglobus tundricola]